MTWIQVEVTKLLLYLYFQLEVRIFPALVDVTGKGKSYPGPKPKITRYSRFHLRASL